MLHFAVWCGCMVSCPPLQVILGCPSKVDPPTPALEVIRPESHGLRGTKARAHLEPQAEDHQWGEYQAKWALEPPPVSAAPQRGQSRPRPQLAHWMVGGTPASWHVLHRGCPLPTAHSRLQPCPTLDPSSLFS